MHSWKLGSYQSTDWEIKALSSLMIAFQSDGLQIPEKDIPETIIKSYLPFKKIYIHFKETEKELTSFPK